MGKGHSKPVISIVLGSYNRRRFLKNTIESVRDSDINVPYEIVVVDGGSTDGSVEWLSRQKDIVTIVQHNHGTWKGDPIVRRNWGYYMNIAFRASHGKYIVMISDDCLLAPDAVRNAYELFEGGSHDEGLGALAFYWKNWPEMDHYFVLKLFDRYYNVNHGMYLRSVLEEVGWIDEDSYRFYYGDSDLSLRIHEAGYHIGVSDRSFVEHYSHANTRVRKSHDSAVERDRETFQERWGHIIPCDPCKDVWETKTFERDPNVCRPFARAGPLFYMGWVLRKRVLTALPEGMRDAFISMYHRVRG